ncbi:uncharacterized protein LOC108915484 [Anoplophora glabripennis]|uniref:uncharacterized protein LOC108915484 n=1 Tax=Anoplophora glabripennis TaxID=217634 RepID=UPI000874EF01|nr:uncharacterized protein LOC108915484 [Anoplophora glabripennis]
MAMMFVLKEVQCQNCSPFFCDIVKIKCQGVECGPDQVYYRRGGGPCGCCSICVTPLPTQVCNPHFCDNIRPYCMAVTCGPGEVALIKPELCRCCPACYPDEKTVY